MKTFTIECVTLEAFCEFNKLDIEPVFEKVRNSDISFGTNDDTLISYYTVCKMCGVIPLRDMMENDLMVSLGS
jgi:hypothetical protein